jgi:hypothetical protein
VTNVIGQVVERHIADGLEEVFHDRRMRALDEAQVKALVENDYCGGIEWMCRLSARLSGL